VRPNVDGLAPLALVGAASDTLPRRFAPLALVGAASGPPPATTRVPYLPEKTAEEEGRPEKNW